MSELTRRILFAVPAGAFFLWVTWLGGISFYLMVALIALAGVAEMTRMLRIIVPGTSVALTLLLALFVWSAPQMPAPFVTGLALLLLAATLAALSRFDHERSRQWLSALFGGFYVPLGFLFFLEIRHLFAGDEGFWLVLALLLMIWGNDIFAYLGGRAFGRRPLAPAISPKKTWEGFWAGAAGSLLGLLTAVLLADPFPVETHLILPAVVLVSLFGPAGDLLASRIKRLSGFKDSSALLPGHGGMLDRFDALILSAPAVYLYLRLIGSLSA